ASWSIDLGCVPVDPEIAAISERAAAVLADSAALRPAPPLEVDDPGNETWAVLAAVSLWTNPRAARTRDGDEPTDAVRRALEASATVTLAEVGAAVRDRERWRDRMRSFFADTEVLVTPSTAVAAFSTAGEFLPVIAGRDAFISGPAPFSVLANLC